MIRALDWLRAAMGAPLETSTRCLGLVSSAVEAGGQGGVLASLLRAYLALGESCTALQQSWELALTSQLTFEALEEPARAHCDNIQPRWTAQIRTGPLAPAATCDCAQKLRQTILRPPDAPLRAHNTDSIA